MPYIILLMHLVSHKRFIYYTNVFVIRYSVMMNVGSCQHTEVQLIQCSPLSEQGVLMALYQVSTFAAYLTLSLVFCLVVFVPHGAMQIIYLSSSLKDYVGMLSSFFREDRSTSFWEQSFNRTLHTKLHILWVLESHFLLHHSPTTFSRYDFSSNYYYHGVFSFLFSQQLKAWPSEIIVIIIMKIIIIIIKYKIFTTKPQLKSYLHSTCCYKKSN